jgi:hypothetical protein
MIAFTQVSPFSLVRRLGTAAWNGSSIYLLICRDEERSSVEDDLALEADAQMGIVVKTIQLSDLGNEIDDVNKTGTKTILSVRVDRRPPDLLTSLDRDIVRLERPGLTLLLLANEGTAGFLLASAPNLRSRVADVLAIGTDAS